MKNGLSEELRFFQKQSDSSRGIELIEKLNLTLYDVWEILRNILPYAEAYRAINEIAKEILKREAKKDISIIEYVFTQKLNETNLKNRETILGFLEWLINFSKGLSDLEKNSEPALCEKISFSPWLNLDKLLRDRNTSKEIKSAFEEISERLSKMCEDIKSGRFISAYFHYTKILKSSFVLLALLSMECVHKLAEEVKRDPLTGLLNRRYMHVILKSITELASITKQPFALALIDIDNFKKVNDTYGHLVGDCVLKQLAELLKKSFRRGDYIFRYGGEEFLIVMPSTDLKEAVTLLERFRCIVQNHAFKCSGEHLKITVSVGVCSDIPQGSINILDYIRCADKKLYEAKKSGKNKVIF